MKSKYSIFKNIFLLTLFAEAFLVCIKAQPPRPRKPIPKNIYRQPAKLPLNQTQKPTISVSPTQTPPVKYAQPTLKGLIKANQEWLRVPEFRIFFNGKQTINDKEGLYSFPTKTKKLDKISILICKQLNQNFEKTNTIKNLTINPLKPYKFISCTRVDKKVDEKTDATVSIWEQKEKTLDKKKFVVPKNCMVILMNPKYLKKVANWDIKFDNNFIKLPQIVLKDNFKEKIVHRQAAKSILRSLDFSTFHENINKKTQKNHKKNVEIILANAK